MKLLYLSLLIMAISSCSTSNKEFHVSAKGNNNNDGSISKPLKTISAAVNLAYAGDIITVHEGTYREWINPLRGGESNEKRITYKAAAGEKVEIKGSEIITGWKRVKDNVWKVNIENSFFGDYNPFKDYLHGDWLHSLGRKHHTGDVYLNGKSLYEIETIDKVYYPVINTESLDPEGSTYTWFCESDDKSTTIWANFHDYDPNNELIEISCRKTCFYPDKPGINYLTISGFSFSQAATQWAAPTAEQIGMIATHWNKGWIIENNEINNTKCSGITIGKERSTGHNVWSADKSIDGSIHYIEVSFKTLKHGWNKENIGSHIIRNNIISNCEQTGICGSMGGAFSIIENNHIYNIWTKRQFSGFELAGIKLHAPIDVIIAKNRIHNCGRGIWLDWMTQGTRVSKNLLYDNNLEDLFIEVNHGPFIIDNNILLSDFAIKSQSQGGAYINNLIAGTIFMWSEPNRFTPYHSPHSTEITGLSTIYSGDDRFYNNIVVGRDKVKNEDEINRNELGAVSMALAFDPIEDSKKELPSFVENNLYYYITETFREDKNYSKSDFNPGIEIIEKENEVLLSLTFDETFFNHKGSLINTEILGKAKIPNTYFENPDGTPLIIDEDYFGKKRIEDNIYAGPFNNIDKGEIEFKVW